MARWFSSDTHFGHQNILRLSNRPFDSVDDHDEFLIDQWNSVVAPHDEVWHLGDVALGQIAVSLPKVGRLNGQKFLISGNHDRVFQANKQSQRERFIPIYQQYFAGIFYGSLDITLADGTVARMSHFPYRGDHFTEDRYPEYRPVDDGLALIHGHIHDLWKVNGNQFNVGVDVSDYRPVPESDIIDWIKSL